MLTLATLVGVLCGTLGLLDPLEKSALITRNLIRSEPASGQIVIIGADEASSSVMGRWPWARDRTAALIDRLNEAQVDSIYFDSTFFGRTNEVADAAFVAALKRSPKPVTLAARYDIDPVTKKRLAAPRFSLGFDVAKNAIINVRLDYWGSTWKLNHGFAHAGTIYPSLASALAGREPTSTESFAIDYAVALSTVPYISAGEAMTNPETAKRLRGKRVVIATGSLAYGDMHVLPGWGLRPGIYIQVLGAETLMRGTPRQLGWAGLLAVALAASALALNRRRNIIAIVSSAALAIAVVTLVIEKQGYVLEVMPAFSVLAFVAVYSLWRRAKRKGGLTNTNTGLPNLEALAEQGTQAAPTVIVARIHNFADILSSLRPEDQPQLIDQIVKRLSLGIGGAQLHQGDQGVFAWLNQKRSSAIADELEGLLAVLNVPVRIDARSIDLQVTFGAESDPRRAVANRVGSALMAADEAYKFGQRWRHFDPALLETAEWRLSLLGQIDAAIDERHIWVAYQPQLDLRTGQIAGAEALVRWTHPERGNISPDEFIRIAEQSGRIERLTLYVIEEAIRAAAKLNARGIPFNISANLSASLISSPYLSSLVTTMLDEAGLDRERLTLEITETIAIDDRTRAIELLHELRTAGIAISIDDYGTGLSTLDYLKGLGADEVKIDKSFVKGLSHDGGDRVMVASTLDLARDLGCRTVAEGVETEEALQVLRELGCNLAQGYYIGRPMPFRALARLLLAENRRRAA